MRWILESNKTWYWIDLNRNCNPIVCKWILKKKLKPNVITYNYKALLVAKVLTQRENIYFFDTLSSHKDEYHKGTNSEFRSELNGC